MKTIHQIRLRSSWITTTEPGVLIYSRSFGRPRTLDPEETIWLVGVGIPGLVRVQVNDLVVPVTGDTFEINISAILQPRNSSAITIQDQPGSSLGEVRLDIRIHTD